MTEILKANLLANFAFFRRSRLLYAFAIVFFLLTALTSTPRCSSNRISETLTRCSRSPKFWHFSTSLVFGQPGAFRHDFPPTHSQPEDGLHQTMFPGALALLRVPFLRFCFPWHCMRWCCSPLFSIAWWWHLAVISGLVFLFANFFGYSVGIIAYLMLLGSIVHPAIAVVVAVLFNADIFYSIWTSTLAMSIYNKSSPRAARPGTSLSLPVSRASNLLPLLGQGSKLHPDPPRHPWRMEIPPAYTLGYSLALSAFCYCLALFALQRRKHI